MINRGTNVGDLAEQPASPFDEARAVADSVLYEGYLLYPYSSLSLSSMAASRANVW